MDNKTPERPSSVWISTPEEINQALHAYIKNVILGQTFENVAGLREIIQYSRGWLSRNYGINFPQDDVVYFDVDKPDRETGYVVLKRDDKILKKVVALKEVVEEPKSST